MEQTAPHVSQRKMIAMSRRLNESYEKLGMHNDFKIASIFIACSTLRHKTGPQRTIFN